jgi:16S rRNA (cytosine967-C5)-methyltransferase
VLPSGTPGSVRAVAQGRARVQDEGSQLVALALTRGAVDASVAALPWLDMCAGPGGKTALLAAVASRQGAYVLATEQHEHRSRLVASAISDADLTAVAAVAQADARAGPWAPASFGRVMLDAPCTGLGALRRRAEARWRRQPRDLRTLVPLQRQLLAAGIDALAPGGLLAYVTCSPHTDETVAVVEAVVGSRHDVSVEHAPGLLGDVPGVARGPHVQLWPDRHGTDAMFLALLRRTTVR